MILLLNWLLFAVLTVYLLVAYFVLRKCKTTKSKLKVIAVLVGLMVLTVFIYKSYHVSHGVRGKAPPLPIVHAEPKQLPIKDNLLKPKEYDPNAIITVREEVKDILEKK